MPGADDASKYSAEREGLELEKLRIEILQLEARGEQSKLERDRTELEVRDLKRPWYRKPQYVLAALPTTLALIGIIAGVYTGYFREKITQQQEALAGYEKQKTELVKSNEKSQQNLKELEKIVDQLHMDTNIATDDLKRITNEKDTLLIEQRELARQVASLNTDRSISQTELQRIEKRSKELTDNIALLQIDLSTADVKSLTDLWLGSTDGEDEASEENEKARDQIVTLFRQRPMQQKQYASFFEKTYLDPKGSPEKYISVVYLLFELTKETKWRNELLNLTLGYLRAFKTDSDRSYRALSTIAHLQNIDDEPIENEIQALVLEELEKGTLRKSHADSVVWLFVKFSNAQRLRGIHQLNLPLYLRVIKIAREAAIEVDDYEFRELRRLSPTAFLAVIAYLIQKQKPVDINKVFRYVAKPTTPMKALEVPATRSLADWKSWVEKPAIRRLVELWFEDDFKTFKSNPELLDNLVDEGKVN